MSKAVAQLQLPPNFEIVSAAEFLAALQPSRDIQRVGSKVVAIIDTAGRWSPAYGLYRLRHKPWRGRWCVLAGGRVFIAFGKGIRIHRQWKRQ